MKRKKVRKLRKWEIEALSEWLKRNPWARKRDCPFTEARFRRNFKRHCKQICERRYPKTENTEHCPMQCGWENAYALDYITRDVKALLREQGVEI